MHLVCPLLCLLFAWKNDLVRLLQSRRLQKQIFLTFRITVVVQSSSGLSLHDTISRICTAGLNNR